MARDGRHRALCGLCSGEKSEEQSLGSKFVFSFLDLDLVYLEIGQMMEISDAHKIASRAHPLLSGFTNHCLSEFHKLN